MTPTVPDRFERWLAHSATAAAAFALGITLAAITGWTFGLPRFRQMIGGFPAMNPFTAILLAAAAVALLVRVTGAETVRRRWTVTVLAFLVFEAALLRLQEFASGWNVGLDLGMFSDAVARVAFRMEAAAATVLLLHGFALLTLDRGKVRGWWLSQLASTLAFALAVFTGAAHAFGALSPATDLFRLTAPPAAIANGLLALATLAARPRGELMSVALDGGRAGRAFRWSLLAVLTVPFGFGWLVVTGVRSHSFGPEVGVALTVGANTLLLLATAWLGTRARIRSDEAVGPARPAIAVVPPAMAIDLVSPAATAIEPAPPAPVALEVPVAEAPEPSPERDAEQEHQRATELREIFLSHVSDQLGAPVQGVIAFMDALREGRLGPLTPEQTGSLEAATHHTTVLRTMIHDLIDATRAQNGKLPVACRRVALRPLISDSLDALQTRAARRGVTLALDPIFTTQDVEADPLRVVQILVNLVDNAIKFTPQGGSVRVSVGISGGHPPFVMVSVADTGCGIAPEQRAHLFDRLNSGERTPGDARVGLGLGLSISRQLALLMAGRLWFESQPGAGSTFHVELPVWSRRPTLARMAPRCIPGEPLALVSVELGDSDGRPLGAEQEPALIEAHHITGTCVLPDKDVLLPREGPADGRERFHLLARAHPEGAEVLRARVDGELRACVALREAGVRYRVTTTPLPSYEEVPGMEPEDFLEGLITSSLAEVLMNEERRAA